MSIENLNDYPKTQEVLLKNYMVPFWLGSGSIVLFEYFFFEKQSFEMDIFVMSAGAIFYGISILNFFRTMNKYRDVIKYYKENKDREPDMIEALQKMVDKAPGGCKKIGATMAVNAIIAYEKSKGN